MARKHSTSRPTRKGGKKKSGAAKKRGARKASGRARRSSTARSAPGRPGVRVRMYRQGLGDCFLLTFTSVAGEESNVLIDCGTLGGGRVKLGDAIDDIIETTSGTLDLLIATHEHWDHVSGFAHHHEKFEENVSIRSVWLAWTENPKDKIAAGLAKYKDDLKLTLAAALSASTLDSDARHVIDGLSAFYGDGSPFALSKGTNEAMNWVREQAKPRYLRPGIKPIEPKWAAGFRFYVLGPPRDEAALKRLGDHGSDELYGLRGALHAATRLARATRADAPKADEATGADSAAGDALQWFDPEDHGRPFDLRYMAVGPATRKLLYPRYDAEDAWRRIDGDWTRRTADLALQLDSLTNNTSLVLAIERVVDGKVLLFPADAQEGNWLSWHDPKMRWTVNDDGDEREVTAADLLARTVFYKVGHHGSHNATAKGSGLELMGDDLVAFIPVDRAIALGRNPKGSWKMPAQALYERLLQKCNGRVVRADIGWSAQANENSKDQVEKHFAGIGSDKDWARWQKSQKQAVADSAVHIDEDERYIEFTLI